VTETQAGALLVARIMVRDKHLASGTRQRLQKLKRIAKA
jgi:hypothetical protein